MSDWGLDSEMVDCMSCGTVSSLDEVSDRGGRCPVCGQYNHDLDSGRHHAAFRRLHTAADPTLPPAFGEDTNVVHRMVGWDLPYVMRQRGHTPESIAQDLKRDPEGTAHSIFGSIEDNYGGIGHHFTRNPAMADYIADVKGDKHDFHVVFSGTHNPEDVNTNNDDLTGGEWPEEEETTLLPGSSVNIHQLKIRPSHSPDWTTVPMNRDSYASWERHHTASTDGLRYAAVVEADVADDLARMRLAAVNQDLVDKLHNEFHQWAVDYAGPSEDLYGDQHNRGPIGEWKNVESFLHDRYPAAHKNHDYGQEEAAWALDGHEPMPYQLENQGKEYGSDLTPYATGPEAVAQHGYDPAEIAASMVLLHNQSHPLRGNLAQEDQDRLTDIFYKRQQMQRDYEKRTKTAMPWYHRTDDELNPGDHLLPYNQIHPDHQEVGDESWNPNKAYVYYGEEDDSSDHAPYAGYGQHIYEIEPHDDPQRDYGDGNHSSHMTDGGTVIKRLPDEDPYSFGEEPQWADPIAHKYASRTAMPAPLPQGVYFRYHPELVWSPGVTAHAPGGKQVGSLEWYDDDHVMVDLGTRRPGEIDRIQVPEDHRGQSIATSMFDFAKQHEPRLHHSDILTEDGRGWSAYEQSRHDHARLASSEWPDPSRETIPADPQYVYHGTHDYNAQDIADFGHLDVHDPDYGTDQDTWPDGSVELRSYWTHDPQVARNFYPEGGRPTLLRSPRSSGDFRQERHSGDLYSTSPISADHLEVYSGPGQWTPLTQHREQRTAGKNGPPPPMTFEPFNTMWTNGIMARHARQVTAANWRTSLGDGLDSDELLTLYHRTTRSNAHQIMQTQGWTPNPERGDYDAPIDAPRTDQHIYFALRPGGDKSYGPSVVSTQVPRGKVKRDETQFWNGGPNDPQWVRVHVDDLAGRPIRRERPR